MWAEREPIRFKALPLFFFGNTIPCQASRLILILLAGIGLILKERWTERMRGLWCL